MLQAKAAHFQNGFPQTAAYDMDTDQGAIPYFNPEIVVVF
jgi:hypothetical protein